EESDRIFADTNALAQDTYDYIIDAIFGVSLNREVGGNYARVIDHVNQMHAYKIAVDIPSGIHADTGLVMGRAFLADETVTFAYKKAGLLLGVAKKYCGRIESVDIGITKESFQGRIPGQFSYQREDIQRIIPKRSLLSNKGSFGKVLLIAGCREIGGACILSAKSLYRSGCGYVRVLTHEANRDLLLSQVPEAVLTTYNDTALDIRAIKSAFDFATVIVIGPGLGEGEMARELLRYALMETQLPMVIDADAINLISKDPVLRDALLEHAKIRDVILTPHPLELQRFSGLDIANIRSRLLDAGREIADKLHVVLVCKNAATVVFDGRRARHLPDTYINQSGNDGLATAGSGDVLSGIIGALLAGGLDAMKSASMGVYLHGLCADLAAEDGSKSYLNAGDLTDFLKFLLE
ncbi:MAG: NAD(P)H-hydrate dehydratase, partial [Lachnospiraceae bacterium]|nr:NAD(P)H-hydrate dehydratase [Lachnospiraceae bacterium]